MQAGDHYSLFDTSKCYTSSQIYSGTAIKSGRGRR